jgi:mannosyltransferase
LVFIDFRNTAAWSLRILYGILLTGLVYSHPLGLYMVAAHGLAYLLVRKSLRLGFRSWAGIQLAVLLAIAPWMPRYLDHGTDYPLPRYSIRFLFAVPIEYIGGNSLVLAACATIIAFGLISFDRRIRRAQRTESLVLLTWTIFPPAAMFVSSAFARPIFGPPRYHLFSAPAYLILLAHGLCKLPYPLRWALAAGAFYLSLSLLDSQVYSQVVKADWRGLWPAG